jgi:hypothetical protein
VILSDETVITNLAGVGVALMKHEEFSRSDTTPDHCGRQIAERRTTDSGRD